MCDFAISLLLPPRAKPLLPLCPCAFLNLSPFLLVTSAYCLVFLCAQGTLCPNFLVIGLVIRLVVFHAPGRPPSQLP